MCSKVKPSVKQSENPSTRKKTGFASPANWKLGKDPLFFNDLRAIRLGDKAPHKALENLPAQQLARFGVVVWVIEQGERQACGVG